MQLVLQHLLLQKEWLKSDVARFTTHVQNCYRPDLLQDRFHVDGKTRNIAVQLVLEQDSSDVKRQVA